MFDSQVLAFMLIAVAVTITPGADTMLVLRNVLRGSRQDGIVTTFGICSGLFVHALLSAVGLSVILMHSATLFTLVKTAGALYLMWLGWQSLRSAIRPAGNLSLDTNSTTNHNTLRKSFVEGFVNNILNPKVVVFYLAFLPQFIKPTDPVVAKSILLAGIHYILGLIWLVSLSFFIDQARRFIIKSSVRRWLDGLCGAILVGLGLRLVFEDGL